MRHSVNRSSTRTSAHLALRIAVGLTAAVVLASCGGDDDDASSSTTTTVFSPPPLETATTLSPVPVTASVTVSSLTVDSTTTPTPTAGPEGTYTVASGDTLSQIAQRFQTSTQAFMDANGITDPDKIFVGQELVVPPPTTPTIPASTTATTAAATTTVAPTPESLAVTTQPGTGTD